MSWSYRSEGKWRIHYLNDHNHRFEALVHIFKTFHEAYPSFVCGQFIESHIGLVKYSAHFVAYFFF